MAFPTVPTVASGDLLSATTSPASTTHTFPSLSSLDGGTGPNAGDLLIAICVQYQGGTLNAEFSSWGASFNEALDDALGSGTGNGALGVATKTATGSESGTFTVTSAHSFKSVQFLMRIPTGTWHGTTGPEIQAATRAAGAIPDPGSFSPSWGAEDNLWISLDGQTETSTTGSPPTLTASPANYSGDLIVARVADAVGDITAGVGFRQLNASSEDVGAWTGTNANRGNGIASVIVVRPAAATDHALAFDFPLALTQDTNLQPTDHPVAFDLPLGLQIDTDLQPPEHPLAFDLPLGLTIDSELIHEAPIAFDFPLALTQDTDLTTTVEHALAFDMPLGLTLDSNLTAELFFAFAEALGLQVDSELTHEAFLAFVLDLGLQIDEGLARETFSSFDLPLALNVDTNLTVAVDHALSFDLPLSLDMQTNAQTAGDAVPSAGGNPSRRRERFRREDNEEEILFILSQL